MADYLTLGSAPCEEPCAQTTWPDYIEKVKKECRAWRNQLERLFPKARFGLKSFPHDFGSYYEVVVWYGNEDEMAMAFKVESELPGEWDEQAKEEMYSKE